MMGEVMMMILILHRWVIAFCSRLIYAVFSDVNMYGIVWMWNEK